MSRRPHISVIGFDSKLCTETAYQAARKVGESVARKGGVVVTGGLGGVMEGANRGARESKGLSVGIIPSENPSDANEYCDVLIPTGLGFARNFLVVNSGDAVVIVGGGAGTLTEAAGAYGKGKIVIAVKGTGGVADEWADKYFDERRTVKVIGAQGPEEAVETAFSMLERRS